MRPSLLICCIPQRENIHVAPPPFLQLSCSAPNGILANVWADGYFYGKMDVYYVEALTWCDSMFCPDPFRILKDIFNIVAVASPS
jgi:IgA Peptidase M64.